MKKIATSLSGKSSSTNTTVGISISLLFAISAFRLTGAAAVQAGFPQLSNYAQYYINPVESSNSMIRQQYRDAEEVSVIILQDENNTLRSSANTAASKLDTKENISYSTDHSFFLPSVKTFEVDLLIDFNESFSNSFAPQDVI